MENCIEIGSTKSENSSPYPDQIKKKKSVILPSLILADTKNYPHFPLTFDAEFAGNMQINHVSIVAFQVIKKYLSLFIIYFIVIK